MASFDPAFSPATTNEVFFETDDAALPPLEIIASSISSDAIGNIYTTGYFAGTVDFDPGNGITTLDPTGADIFVHKMDSSGNFIWARSFGGIGEDRGLSLKVDDLGNVYTTGAFNGTADFDPSTGTANLTSNGFQDAFVSKLNANGDFVWVKQMGGSINWFQFW